MTWRPPERIAARFVLAIVLACSAAAIGLYVFTALHRMRFRFELEWMEGGILEHVKRVLSGKPLYPAPSVDFTPFIYNPLYYYVAAPFCLLFGLELFPLRLVSFIASLASFFLIFLTIKKHTGQVVAGVLGAGMFAASFVACGAWFDLARVDSLALALVLAAGFVLIGREDQSPPRRRTLIAAGVLTALAILTKQSAALIAPLLLLRAFTLGRLRGAILFGAALLVPLGAAVIALQIRSGGWYWYYAYQLPSTHGMAGHELILNVWRYELFAALPILCTIGLIELCSAPVTATRKNWFVPAFAATLILISYVTRLHGGSYINDLMPATAALAILGATLLSRLARLWRAAGDCAPTWLVGAVQILLLFYAPDDHQRPAGSREAGIAIVDWLRSKPGEVWVVSHPYLNTLAGKPSHLHFMSLVDVQGAGGDPRGAWAMLRRQIDEALRQGRFSHVVLDDNWFVNSDALHENYVLESSALIPSQTALWPITGSHFRPTLVYRKK